MSEPITRLLAFGGAALLLSAWESLAPRRTLVACKSGRWRSHFMIAALNTIALRTLHPTTAVLLAHETHQQHWGALGRIDWPWWVEFAIGFLLLDLIIYGQHVLMHKVPLLWRLHRVHHADLDVDFTTGIRFHTLEILLSMLLKFAAVLAIGPSAACVLVFEIVLNVSSMFNHANARIAARLEPLLRWIVVTPDMHRVHHSVVRRECDSNFGFNLPWWDYVFRTYVAQPAAGHDHMELGLATLRDERRTSRLPALLLLPFTRDNTDGRDDLEDRRGGTQVPLENGNGEATARGSPAQPSLSD